MFAIYFAKTLFFSVLNPLKLVYPVNYNPLLFFTQDKAKKFGVSFVYFKKF